MELLLDARGRDRGERRGADAARVAERRQAVSIAADEMPFSCRQPPLLRRRGADLEGKAAGEYVEGYTSIIRREPLGIVAGITPVELPADHGGLEDRAGARGRQRHRSSSRPSRRRSRRCASPSSRRRSSRPGVLHVITGDGIPVGDALVRDPDIRLVSLTGDAATGKTDRAERRRHRSSASTSSSAARRRWSCSTTPTRPTVAEAIKIGGYWNSGQDCTASSRILVSERIYDDVLSETVKADRGDEGRRPGRGRRRRTWAP